MQKQTVSQQHRKIPLSRTLALLGLLTTSLLVPHPIVYADNATVLHLGVFTQKNHAIAVAERGQTLLKTRIRVTVERIDGVVHYSVMTAPILNPNLATQEELNLQRVGMSVWKSHPSPGAETETAAAASMDRNEITRAIELPMQPAAAPRKQATPVNQAPAQPSVQPNAPAYHAPGTYSNADPNDNSNISSNANSNASGYNDPNANDPNAHLWNLRNADIRSVIATISKITGKNFIIDNRVQGTISIVSSKTLRKEEVYQVFLAMLQTTGFVAIPTSDPNVIKIMPNTNAREADAKVASGLNPGKGDETVVRVVNVRYVPAERFLAVLRPLIPQWSTVAVYEPTNSLILSGSASKINGLLKIIDQIDTPKENQVDIITLKSANALNVVHTIQGLQMDRSTYQSQVKIAADERANVILVSGPRTARMQMRMLINELDQSSPKGSGNTQVIYLRYMHTQDLVPILAGVARSNYLGPVGTVIGTRSDQQKLDTGVPTTNQGYPPMDRDYGGIPPDAQGMQGGNQAASSATADATKPGAPPPVEIIGEPNTNAIIINAPERVMRILKSVIAKVDIRPAQVLVEALIAEISEDDTKLLGIQWGTVSTDDLAKNNAASLNNFNEGIGIINRAVIKNSFSNYQAVIRALARENKANILSTPSVVVLDNHQAKILVGKQVSIKNSEYPNNAGGTTGATPFTTFDRMDVALKLFVTPQINQGETVQLLIAHENDTLDNPADNSDTPRINKSSINTTVLIHSGDVLVLGGLIQNTMLLDRNHIPFLGRLPFVGSLFRDKTHNFGKKNLMVFIRPIILNTTEKDIEVTNDKYHLMRSLQLEDLQHFEYSKDINQMLLPPLEQVPSLPKPFPEDQVAIYHESATQKPAGH